MSFSALLAKSDSNENILVDVDEKTAESYILIDNDLDKQVDVEVESEPSTGGAEAKVEKINAYTSKNTLPPMNQVNICLPLKVLFEASQFCIKLGRVYFFLANYLQFVYRHGKRG